MTVVFGIDFPVLEFFLILNVIMLIYVIISMFEIRSLIKLRKGLEQLIGKPAQNKEVDKPITEVKPIPEVKQEEKTVTSQ